MQRAGDGSTKSVAGKPQRKVLPKGRMKRTASAAGEDGIPPEVIKNCDLDEIIIGYVNRPLLEGKKPHK